MMSLGTGSATPIAIHTLPNHTIGTAMSLGMTLKTTLVGLCITAIVIAGMAIVLRNTRYTETAIRQLTDDVLKQQIESEHFNLHIHHLLAQARTLAQSPSQHDALAIEDEIELAQRGLTVLQQLLVPDDEFDIDISDVRMQLLDRRRQLLGELTLTIREIQQRAGQSNENISALGKLDALEAITSELEQDSDKVIERAIDDATIAASTGIGRVDTSVIVVLSLLVGVLLLTVFFVWRTVAQPITRLAHAVGALAGGDLSASVAVTNKDELGVLQQNFNQTSQALRLADERVAEQQRLLERRVEERTAELRHTLGELQAANQAEAELRTTIRDLSMPIVPILDGIVVMPLIGMIDAGRAHSIITTLLHGIEQHRARTVFLDVTGVPLIDTYIAQTLIQASDAARLLGAETVLVGLRPELAQTIVGLGVSLAGLKTRADLQSGMRAELAMMPHSA